MAADQFGGVMRAVMARMPARRIVGKPLGPPVRGFSRSLIGGVKNAAGGAIRGFGSNARMRQEIIARQAQMSPTQRLIGRLQGAFPSPQRRAIRGAMTGLQSLLRRQ